MPKWDNYYLVSFVNVRGNPQRGPNRGGRHRVVGNAADAYRSYYHIPPVRCFTLTTTYTAYGDGRGRVTNVVGRVIGGTLLSRMGGNALGLVSIDDKLIMVGHGRADYGIEHIRGWRLATTLYDVGLRNVGLIAFKSCLLGQGAFLDDLGNTLTNLGVNFGWLIGYRERAATRVTRNGAGEVTSVHEDILDRYAVFDTPWTNLDNLRRGFLRQFGRIKVVQGNTHLARPGLRHYADFL